MITRVKGPGKEDEPPLMKNNPIFESRSGNTIIEKQDDKEYFNGLRNDMQYSNNNKDNGDYFPKTLMMMKTLLDHGNPNMPPWMKKNVW